MKSIISVIGLVVVFFSCQEKGTKERSRLDTFTVAKYWVIAPNGRKIGPVIDTAIYRVEVRYVFKDTSLGTGGHWQTDTTGKYGRISDDTLRDVFRRPILDSAHHAQFHYIYYALQDSLVTPVTKLVRH